MQDSKTLSVTMKINGFIREMGLGMPVQQASTGAVTDAAPAALEAAQ
jgi:hypothetical protein